MAVAELILSRRALLGAACVAALSRRPELVSGSILPPTPPSSRWTLKQVQGDGERVAKWNDALARYRSAEAALAAGQGACDSRFDRLLGRHNRALSRLLRSPAPDVPALAVKPVLSEVEGLDALVANQAWELSFAPACLAALRRDARRLAAAAAG